jgi:hypothetical protein
MYARGVGKACRRLPSLCEKYSGNSGSPEFEASPCSPADEKSGTKSGRSGAEVRNGGRRAATIRVMFSPENTEGFTAADLVLLNRAVRLLMQDGIPESNAHDLVTNNWRGDGTDSVASLATVRTPHVRIPGV